MKLKVLKKHLDKAVKIMKNKSSSSVCDECVFAQAAKEVFKDNFKSMGTTIHVTNGRYEPVKEQKELWTKTHRMFDHEQFKELRKMLPLTFDIELY
jgi:hypothetical protein